MVKPSLTLRSSRGVQLLFVLLLVTCLGQVAWWVVDQKIYAGEVQDLVGELLEHDAEVAEVLGDEHGLTTAQLTDMFPDVEFLPGGSAIVAGKRLDLLRHKRQARLRRYDWEAAFFVVVLLSTLGLIGITLQTRTELLRRQQNFLAAVSHELKSPLASIKLSAETLLMREPDRDATRRIAERMVHATERLTGMVTNLLDTARLDEERIELVQERLHLKQLVERVLNPIRCASHIHAVEITTDISDALQIQADPAAAQSVIANLLSNAVKSAQAQGGGQVHLSAQGDAQQVVLQVKDDGMGFEPHLAEQLFERFFRPGNELVRRTKGSGLGLFIVRRFMQLDGGRITASSDGEGQGALFEATWRAPIERRSSER